MINCKLADRPGALPLGRRIDSSGLLENALDHVHGNPVDPRHLGNRHPVLHPGADTRKLRGRDLGRYPLLGFDWRLAFLVTDRRWRQRLQHTRFTWRLVDRGKESETDDCLVTCRFVMKSASADRRALVIRSRSSSRGGQWPASTRQRFLRAVYPFVISKCHSLVLASEFRGTPASSVCALLKSRGTAIGE